MNTDLKHYLFFSFSQMAKVLLSMVTMALLARILGPSGLGQWAMIIACATFFHMVLANWLQQDAFLQFGKQEWVQTQGVEKTWNTLLPFFLAGGLIAAFLTLGSPWNSIRELFQLRVGDGPLVMGFFFSLWLGIEVQTWLQITGRMISLAMAPLWIAGLCIPFYAVLYVRPVTDQPLPIALGGTVVITLCVWFALWLKNRGFKPWHFSWDAQQAGKILRFASPILPTTLLGYWVNWGNQLLIQKHFASRDVGLYQSAFQIHFLLVTLAVPLTTIILPRLIDKHLHDAGIMKRYVQTIAPTLFCLWLLALIPAMAFLPRVFLWVYSRAFADSLPLLTLLMSGTLFCALGQIYTALYTVQGRLSRIFWILLATVSINFFFAWVWIPQGHSLSRTALAFGGSFIFAQLLTALYQHRVLQEPPYKLLGLVGVALLFALGQIPILHPLGRMLWAACCFVLLIAAVRGGKIVDRPTLTQLFTGRLQPLGHQLTRLLIS